MGNIGLYILIAISLGLLIYLTKWAIKDFPKVIIRHTPPIMEEMDSNYRKTMFCIRQLEEILNKHCLNQPVDYHIGDVIRVNGHDWIITDITTESSVNEASTITIFANGCSIVRGKTK